MFSNLYRNNWYWKILINNTLNLFEIISSFFSSNSKTFTNKLNIFEFPMHVFFFFCQISKRFFVVVAKKHSAFDCCMIKMIIHQSTVKNNEKKKSLINLDLWCNINYHYTKVSDVNFFLYPIDSICSLISLNQKWL